MNEILPWKRLLEISYGMLQLTPEVFWDMTPCEWLAAIKGFKYWHRLEEKQHMTRQELEKLRQRFPDVTARRG